MHIATSDRVNQDSIWKTTASHHRPSRFLFIVTLVMEQTAEIDSEYSSLKCSVNWTVDLVFSVLLDSGDWYSAVIWENKFCGMYWL